MKTHMLNLLKDFPKQIKDAARIAKKAQITVKGKINNIIICGMGGSAIAGLILKDCLKDEIKVPITITRSYSIPKFVDNNTLAIMVSYSGNTAETLSAYKEALKRKAKIVAITSNGKLSSIKNSIKIPKGFPPRTALAYIFFPILIILEKAKLIKNKKKETKETVALLKKFNPQPAKSLAKTLQDKRKIPVIYSSSSYKSAAYRWKTQLNENSKVFAAFGIFPEVCHNEVEADFKNIRAIMLKDPQEHPKTKKQMDAFKRISKANTKEILLKGKSRLAKIFYSIYFGDYTSYYLSKLKKVNPVSKKRIEALKKEIKK